MRPDQIESPAMYVLHYAPDNASLILRFALEEAGLPYSTALVDRTTRQQDSAEYRALNPTGLIPTLVTPDGPISETAACLLWLADRHPKAGLAPQPADPSRAAFLKWLFFLSNTAHADLRQIFYPEQYVPPAAIADHHNLLTARMKRHFTLLDRAAHDNPTLFAAPGVLALYTATLLRWPVLYPKKTAKWLRIADYPFLLAMALALESRPAIQSAAQAEGLGTTPFTNPQYAAPPEGSAT